MENKKILFLGGAFSQVPAIKYAKYRGLNVTTVDFLPNNPGHQFSDNYFNLSTVNREQVLELSRKLAINAISAFASDPAAPTAAYVGEKMNLIGSSLKSVETLSNKNLFRKFLKDNGFKTPWFIYGSNINIFKKYFKNTNEHAILKPVDSSGSKGIYLIKTIEDLNTFFPKSMSFSRSGKVILEQFIEKKGPQIHGEGFIQNGGIIFLQFGDQFFSNVNNLVPYSTMVPTDFHKDILDNIHGLIIQVIKKIGFKTGGINIELIRDKNDNLFILEIGARSGGNFMPQLMKHATGFDLIKAHIDSLFNVNIKQGITSFQNEKYFQVILHSESKGKFLGINIPTEFENNILEQYIYYPKNQIINTYQNSKDVIGVIIFKINNNQIDLFHKYLKSNQWVNVN